MGLAEVAYLASEQLGLFTTAQATVLGVERSTLSRNVLAGTLRSPRRGVYAFESTPYSPGEELRAAWLSLDPAHTVAQRLQNPTAIVVGTTSAAAHYGIGDFDTLEHEFYTNRRKQTRAEDIRLRVRRLDAGEVDIRQGLPLTTVPRIVGDLLAERFDLGHISRMIADAINQGLPLDWDHITHDATKHAPAYGLSPDRLLAELATASESPADTATTTRSMLESNPTLKRLLSEQLAASLDTISKTMVMPDLSTFSQIAAQEVSQLPALTQLQDRIAAELAKQLPPLPTLDMSLPLDLSAPKTSEPRSDRPSRRDNTTDKDDPSTDESSTPATP